MAVQTFNLQQLAGHRALVTGVDYQGVNRSAFLDTREWDAIKDALRSQLEEDSWNDEVRAFFRPLVEAAEEYNVSPVVDPAFLYTLDEGVETVEGRPAVIADLDYDTAVMRMLVEGDHTRLLWVHVNGEDSIEILAPSIELPEEKENPTLF